MQGALTQEYLGSFEEAQHSRRRSGPQNYVVNFQDRTLELEVDKALLSGSQEIQDYKTSQDSRGPKR